MNTKRITFQNARGEQLAARLELPDDEQPLAYALFAHCFTCSKNLKAAVNICRAMSSRRIAVLRFDFTGLGESEGDFARTTFSSEVSDLVAAARFLEREYAAPGLLVGHSLGGAAVLAAASQIPSTKAIATIAAPFDPAHLRHLLGETAKEIERAGHATVNIGGRDFTIGKELLDDLEVQRPEEILRSLKGALLILHSPADHVVGIANATGIFQAARHPKSFVTLDTADHLLSNPDDSRYVGEVIASWAGRYLGPAPGEARPSPAPQPADHRTTARTGADSYRTDIFTSGFSLVCDEPLEAGGGNEGPSPYDYLLAALAACTGMTLQMYARRKGWPLEEVLVRLARRKGQVKDGESAEHEERRGDHFERELELRGDLDEAQRQRLVEIAERCPVHRTLTGQVEIETKVAPPSVDGPARGASLPPGGSGAGGG